LILSMPSMMLRLDHDGNPKPSGTMTAEDHSVAHSAAVATRTIPNTSMRTIPNTVRADDPQHRHCERSAAIHRARERAPAHGHDGSPRSAAPARDDV